MTIDEWIKKYPPGQIYYSPNRTRASGPHQCAQYAGDLYEKVYGFKYKSGDGYAKAGVYISAYKNKGIIDATAAVKATGELRAGDMVSTSGSTGAGHVFIVLSNCTTSNIHGIDCNWGGGCKVDIFNGAERLKGTHSTIKGVARLEKATTGYEGNYINSQTAKDDSQALYIEYTKWKGEGTINKDYTNLYWYTDSKKPIKKWGFNNGEYYVLYKCILYFHFV